MPKYMSLFKKEKGSVDGVVARAGGAKVSIKKELIKPKAKKVVAAPPLMVVDAPAERYFWVYQGGALRNLHDLADALEFMSEEQFDFHTKRDGNDFANWTREVFQAEELAERLTKLKTRTGHIKAIRKAIGE